MAAVAAVLRHLGEDRPLTVATTKYVVQDPSSHFLEMARDLEVEPYAAPLDFSRSPFPGLADYERGFVKEGVGAGGLRVVRPEAGGVPGAGLRPHGGTVPGHDGGLGWVGSPGPPGSWGS